MTLTFFRLGKIDRADALFYVTAQFVGGASGVLLAGSLLGSSLAAPTVNYVVTVPGQRGDGVAFGAELAISFCLMIVVLTATDHPRWTRYTGVFAGLLIATYITLQAPLSGMSMNPARTVGSALPAGVWDSTWIYFTAPLAGMLHVQMLGKSNVEMFEADAPAFTPHSVRRSALPGGFTL